MDFELEWTPEQDMFRAEYERLAIPGGRRRPQLYKHSIMVQLINRGWRSNLAEIAGAAEESLLVAAPYVKDDEAAWLCGLLRQDIEVLTLARMEVQAISSSSLDVEALLRLARVSPTSKLVVLPNLHAKVFVADDKYAVITSGNLTRSGLDTNIEYGVVLRERTLVRTVREDMLRFARLGSAVSPEAIADLLPLQATIREAEAEIARSAPHEAQRRFDEIMWQAKPAFAAMQVGDRSANAIFGEAIQLALAEGPQPTTVIHERIRQLLPDFCDDTEDRVINGIHFGKRWKHNVRNAQQSLKRRGVVTYDDATEIWALTRPSVQNP